MSVAEQLAALARVLGLLEQHGIEVEIDAAYAAYDESPLDTPDEWGDLASFRTAAGEA